MSCRLDSLHRDGDLIAGTQTQAKIVNSFQKVLDRSSSLVDLCMPQTLQSLRMNQPFLHKWPDCTPQCRGETSPLNKKMLEWSGFNMFIEVGQGNEVGHMHIMFISTPHHTLHRQRDTAHMRSMHVCYVCIIQRDAHTSNIGDFKRSGARITTDDLVTHGCRGIRATICTLCLPPGMLRRLFSPSYACIHAERSMSNGMCAL